MSYIKQALLALLLLCAMSAAQAEISCAAV